MALDEKVLVSQIDAVITRYQEARSRAKYEDLSDLPKALQNELLMIMGATVDRLAPHGSRYREDAHYALGKYGSDNPYNLNTLLGILNAMKADYLAGRLTAVQELIQADIFADFLEMAHYLLEQDYKDPAAVLVGGVLEEHLRKLCEKNGIAIAVDGRPKKADTMNSELTSAGVYGKLDQKSVTAWLDLRNKAAHGRYGEYTKQQVELMLQGVRDFISRTL